MNFEELRNEYKLEMDDQKQKIVCDVDHSLFIDGRAGSGKTFLFLSRIAYLLKKCLFNEVSGSRSIKYSKFSV